MIPLHLKIRKECLGDGVACAVPKDRKSTHIKDCVWIDKKEGWSLKGSLVTTKDVYLGIDLVNILRERSKTSLQHNFLEGDSSLQHFARRDVVTRIKNMKQKWWQQDKMMETKLRRTKAKA